MTELADFLLARIADDEAAANHARWAMQGEWFATADDKVDEFVRRNSPARVLAECEAKRRIVSAESSSRVLHDMVGDVTVHSWSDEGAFVTVNGERMTTEEFNAVFTEPSPPSRTLRLLALPYADHPDYREEWRP